MNAYDRNNNVSESNADNEATNDPGSGKRQRFLNLVRSTKDVYIPSLASSISQKTADSFRRGSNERTAPLVNFPHDMDIIFYPTYSTKVGAQYETTIRLAVSSPGNPASRKNRLLFSLCKQLVKPLQSDEFPSDPVDIKSDEGITSTDTRSALSSGSTNSSTSTSGQVFNANNLALNELDILKERTLGFFTRHVPNLPIIIDILSKNGLANSESISKITDERGYLYTRIRTDFLPSSIRITLDTPVDFPKIISREYSCSFVKPGGYGIISDIDDTIKHTGVTGDKRSMFRNVFINDIESWLINDISQWYKILEEQFDIDFFYVSNSPMQIYPILQQYITKYFPRGPLFLKQYSGNLLSSIMTSSANRKLLAIRQVCKDFPDKKLILVGDSGEQDFEAYITTAMEHPDQIIGIYIRCCKDSMSDMGVRELEVMEELNDMINDEYLGPGEVSKKKNFEKEDINGTKLNLRRRPPPSPHFLPKKPKISPELEKMIKDSRPPPVPARKPRLSAQQEAAIRQSHLSFESNLKYRENDLPPLPPRQPTQRDSDPAIYYTPSTQNDYGAYSSFFDKKADNWRNRLANGIRELNHLKKNRKIRLMFFMKPNSPLKDCMMEIQQR